MSDDGRMHVPGPSDIEVAGDATGGPDEQRPAHFPRRVTSFRARRSTISDRQQAIWDARWPELGMQARTGDEPAAPLDTDAWFGRRARWCSRSAAAQGRRRSRWRRPNPDVDVVAVEVYRRGLAQLLAAIDRAPRPTRSPTSG